MGERAAKFRVLGTTASVSIVGSRPSVERDVGFYSEQHIVYPIEFCSSRM